MWWTLEIKICVITTFSAHCPWPASGTLITFSPTLPTCFSAYFSWELWDWKNCSAAAMTEPKRPVTRRPGQGTKTPPPSPSSALQDCRRTTACTLPWAWPWCWRGCWAPAITYARPTSTFSSTPPSCTSSAYSASSSCIRNDMQMWPPALTK